MSSDPSPVRSSYTGQDTNLLFSPASNRAQEHIKQLASARVAAANNSIGSNNNTFLNRSHSGAAANGGHASSMNAAGQSVAGESRAGLLQVELDHAHSKLNRQEELLRTLRREKDESDEQIRSLKNHVRDSKDAVAAEWRAKFQNLSNTADKLREDLRVKTERVEELLEEKRDAENKQKKADAVRNILEQTQDELAKTEIMLAQARKSKQELQSEMESLKKDNTVNVLRGKVSEAVLSSEDAQKHCRVLQEQNLGLIRELEGLKDVLAKKDIKASDEQEAKMALVVELQDLRSRLQNMKRVEEDLINSSSQAKEAQSLSQRSLVDDLETAKHSRDLLESEIGEIHREHKRRVHSLEILMEQKSADAESLNKQLAIYKNKCEERAKEVSELEGLLVAEKKRRDQLDKESSKDRIVVEDLRRQIQHLKEDAQIADSENETLLREKLQLVNEVGQLNDALSDMHSHVQSSRLRDEIAEQTSKDLEAAEKQTIALYSEIEQLKAQLASATVHQDKLTKANATCSDLISQLGVKDATIDGMKVSVEEAEERYHNATSRLRILEAKLKAEEGRREEILSKLKTAEIINREHETLQLSGKLQALEKNLNSRDGEVAKLVHSNSQALEELSGVKANYKSLSREHSDALERMRSLEVRIVELQVDRDELRLKVARSSGSEEAMSTFHSQQQEVIAELQESLKNLQSENGEMRKQLIVAEQLEDLLVEERNAAQRSKHEPDSYRSSGGGGLVSPPSVRRYDTNPLHGNVNPPGNNATSSGTSFVVEPSAMSPIRQSHLSVPTPQLGGPSRSVSSAGGARDYQAPPRPTPLQHKESHSHNFPASFQLAASQPSSSLQEPAAGGRQRGSHHGHGVPLSSALHSPHSTGGPLHASPGRGSPSRGTVSAYRPRPVPGSNNNSSVMEETVLAMRAEMQDLKESKEVESRSRDQRIDMLATNLSHAISAMKDLRKGAGGSSSISAPTPTSAASASRTTAVKSPVRTASATSTKPPRTPSSAKRLMSSTATSAARQRNPTSTTTPVKSTPKRPTTNEEETVSDEEISTILLDPTGMSDEELMRELELAKRQMKKVLLKKDRFVETPAKKNPRF